MSAIGGWVDFFETAVGWARLDAMSRSMMGRGVRRDGYLGRGIRLFRNAREEESRISGENPLTLDRAGSCRTLVCDGYCGASPRGALEAYGGGEPLPPWQADGSFALALYDEGRGELILARDRQGSRPLFYAIENGALGFATEIKGVLRFLRGGATVDRRLLVRHAMSPFALDGVSLYRGIEEVPVDGAMVYSRMGLTRLFYGEPTASCEEVGTAIVVRADERCDDEETLRRLLTEALFAYDYPRFDALMPSLLLTVEREKNKGARSVTVEDGARHVSIRYATERAERLGSALGVEIRSVAPSGRWDVGKETKHAQRLEKLCASVLDTADRSVLRYLFGDWESLLRERRDVMGRIATEGILWQSALWAQSYPILFE